MRTKHELFSRDSARGGTLFMAGQAPDMPHAGARSNASRPEITRAVTRGTRRELAGRGFSSIVEVPLKGGRRADIIAIDKAGQISIVEVKSSLADYACDAKWRGYLAFCDRFYFAVPDGFPQESIPQECGLWVADAYGAHLVREPVISPLPGARRRAMLLRLARLSADRLHQMQDPGAQGP